MVPSLSRGASTYLADEWGAVRTRVFGGSVRRAARPDQEVGCLEWQGPVDKGGYGILSEAMFSVVEGMKSRTSASRAACWLSHGPPPEPTSQARHLCHNPPCVEPTHLAWGTQLQNSNDSVIALRYPTKLSRDQVDRIRDVYAAGGHSCKALADEYGVAVNTIHSVVSGRTWRWTLTCEQIAALDERKPPPPTAPKPALTDRLAWFAPPKPDGMTDEDHVNRWVLDMSHQHGTTPTEAVQAILSGRWTANRPVTAKTADRLDIGTVLAYAAQHGISTSDAANALAAPH